MNSPLLLFWSTYLLFFWLAWDQLQTQADPLTTL